MLDLGSGEGYGSAILAGRAKAVLGIEIDPQAVEHARENYVHENLEYRQRSILELEELEDDSFDLVVCYEVIEHITEHEALLSTVQRVLGPGGIFVVSTPDREIYSEAVDYHNPYHSKELSHQEFAALLGGFFSHHKMWGQLLSIGSVLEAVQGDPSAGPPEEIFVHRIGERWERHDAPPVPYLVAVASDTQLPSLPNFSLLNDPSAAALYPPPDPGGEPASAAEPPNRHFELWDTERLQRQVEIFEGTIAAQIDALAEVNAERDGLRQELERAVAALEEAVSAADALHRSDQQAADLRHQLDEITGSRAWRLVSSYRRLRAAPHRTGP